MLQADENARTKHDAAWRQFITLLEYKGNLYGTHVVQVEARGTTKECAKCGVETEKPLWVRKHSCPSCGFETDRDANASINILKRGFAELGMGWPEDTPVETVTVPRNSKSFWCANESKTLVNATDTTDFRTVSASHVVETGSLPS